MHIAYTITYNVHTASRVSEAQKKGGGAPPPASQNGLAPPPPWQTGAPQVIFEKKNLPRPPLEISFSAPLEGSNVIHYII